MDAEWRVIDPHSERVLGRVRLNGRHIGAGGPLGRSGAMRSFTVVVGNLWDYWASQRQMLLIDEDGSKVLVRVAAFPAERGENGFLEFVDDAAKIAE